MLENTKKLIDELNDHVSKIYDNIKLFYNSVSMEADILNRLEKNRVHYIWQTYIEYIKNFEPIETEVNKENFYDLFIECSILYILGYLLKEKKEQHVKSIILKCLKFFKDDKEFLSYIDRINNNELKYKNPVQITDDIINVISACLRKGKIDLKVMLDICEYVFKKHIHKHNYPNEYYLHYHFLVLFCRYYIRGEEVFLKIISDSIIKYFSYFCCNPNTKRFLYSDLCSLMYIEQMKKKDTSYDWNSLNPDECTNILNYYYLFSETFKESLKFLPLISLYKNVFCNRQIEDDITILGKQHYGAANINIYSIATSFLQFWGEKNINKYPGFIALIYFISKEMREEDFNLLFAQRSKEENITIKSIASDIIFSMIDSDHDNDEDNSLFSCKKKLKELFSHLLENENFDDIAVSYQENSKLLNNLLFFAIWENSSAVSYFQCDTDYQLQLKFKSICEFSSKSNPNDLCWDNKKVRIELYNDLAKKYNFLNNKDKPFCDELFNANESNEVLIKTLFYLSRTQREVEDSFPYLISYIGELKNNKFRSDINSNSKLVNKSECEKISRVDFGFNVENFQLFLFPFVDSELKLKLAQYGVEINNFAIKKDVTFKLFCESDKKFYTPDKGNEREDWKETICKGFETRYLYKDRNMIIHSSLHNTVNDLINEKYWYKLLYTLHSYCKYLEKHLNKTKEDCMLFSLKFLKKWISGIFDELCDRLDTYCEIKEIRCPDKIEGNIDEIIDKYNEKIRNKDHTNNDKPDKQYEYYYPKDLKYDNLLTKTNISDKTIQKRELSFKKRLIYTLNLMFNVNGNMNDGIEFNSTNYDIFTTYHSKIALYLVYLASKFF